MRGRLCLAAAAVLAGLGLGAARAQVPDLLDLYRSLQVAQPSGFPTYELKRRAGKVTASGGLLYGVRARLSVVYDPDSLYLRIDDRGDGDGATPFVTEIAVWLDEEGAPLLGLSERALRGGTPIGGRLRFYSLASGRWNLVTDRVWPALDEAVCRSEPQEVDETTAAFEGLGQMVALLPRKGTDAQVWCVGPSPVAGTGAMVTWERDAGRFSRGNALPGPPPWPDRAKP